MTNPTASKRDQVLAYLREHPGASVAEVAAGIGCNLSTAYRWVGSNTAGAPMSEKKPQDEQDEDELPEGAEPEGDVVVVDRSYLQTLEALRDQVLETQRLRRALDGR